MALTGNLTIPVNMRTRCEADGTIHTSGNHTLTINNWSDPGDLNQYFFPATTSDKILLGNGATPVEHLEWWAGAGNGSNDDHAFTQWHASGGRVKRATHDGPYYCTDQTAVANAVYLSNKFTKLRNTSTGGSNPTWKIPAGVSDVEITGFWFDQQSSTTARGLELQVTAGGASKFNINVHDNFFSGSGVNAPPMLDLISTGSNAEFVQIWIQKNGFQNESGSYCIGTDSTNIKVHISNNAWYAGIGANFCEFTNSGWLDIDENDLRGPAGANYNTGVSETSQRTQANVSVASGGRALTILAGTTPAFTKDDEGQRVVISGKFDSYIEEVIDPYHATLSSAVAASSGAATNANMTVYRQTDPTGLANIAYHFKGDRAITTIKSTIDEGICHFLKVDLGLGKANSPINIVGGQIQGRLTCDSTTEFNFFGTEMYSGALRQGGGVAPVLNGIITPLCTTLYRGTGSFNGFRQLAKGNPIGNNSSLWVMPNLTMNRETNAFSITPLVQLKDAVLKGTVSGGDQPTDALRLKGSTNSDKTAYTTINEDGGNVGFGIATPLHKGHFYDPTTCKVAVDSPLSQDAQFRLMAANVDYWAIYRPSATTQFRIYNFTLGDDNFMIDPSTGRIGIRNNFPTELLTLGFPGVTGGEVGFAGTSSGHTKVQAPAAAGSPTLTWPTVTGTLQQQFTTAVTSSSTPTVTGDCAYNILDITALAANATFAAPSGTPLDGNRIRVRWKDNGTSRTLGYNAIFRAVGVTLPAATTISKTGYFDAVYNGTDSKWDVIAVVTEGVTPSLATAAVYRALLSQSSTAAPTATVAEQTLAGTLTWSYVGVGRYRLTNSVAEFVANKTHIFMGSSFNVSGGQTQLRTIRSSTTVIDLEILDCDPTIPTAGLANGLMTETPFTILVYP
jgi:hypothetical protein